MIRTFVQSITNFGSEYKLLPKMAAQNYQRVKIPTEQGRGKSWLSYKEKAIKKKYYLIYAL